MLLLKEKKINRNRIRTNLEYDARVHMGLIQKEKTRGQKSGAVVPLIFSQDVLKDCTDFSALVFYRFQNCIGLCKADIIMSS